MNNDVDSGWDACCSRAVGGRLLRAAAALYELAGSRGNEAIRHRLEATVHRLKKVAFTITDEANAREVFASIDMATDDIECAIADVKVRAKVIRGQLDLFDVNDGDALVVRMRDREGA